MFQLFLVITSFILAFPLEAAKDGDIELAIKLSPGDLPQVKKVFNLRDADSNQRINYFFDTDKKDLNKHGIAFRARIAKEKVQLTIKTRPADNNLIKSLPDALQKKLECEQDRGFHSPAAVDSCSLSSQITRDALLAAIDHSSNPLELLDQDQSLLMTRLLKGDEIEAVYPYGPVRTNTWKDLTQKKLGIEVTVEVWWLPLNRAIVEISTRANSKQLPAVVSDLSTFFKNNSLTTIPDFTKTDYVLQNYRSLRSQQAAEELDSGTPD